MIEHDQREACNCSAHKINILIVLEKSKTGNVHIHWKCKSYFKMYGVDGYSKYNKYTADPATHK